jgi:hypothetical protein
MTYLLTFSVSFLPLQYGIYHNLDDLPFDIFCEFPPFTVWYLP